MCSFVFKQKSRLRFFGSLFWKFWTCAVRQQYVLFHLLNFLHAKCQPAFSFLPWNILKKWKVWQRSYLFSILFCCQSATDASLEHTHTHSRKQNQIYSNIKEKIARQLTLIEFRWYGWSINMVRRTSFLIRSFSGRFFFFKFYWQMKQHVGHLSFTKESI